MLSIRLTAVITALVLITPFLATAAEEAPFPLFSFENTSCGNWTESQSDSVARQTYLFWFRGFVSGYNFGSVSYEVPLTALPDNTTLVLYIDKHCRENPLLPFVSAALPLVKEQRTKIRRVK
ncbi:hypothetical protein SCD_n02610 [Sulfuricella denitrificans skB26]|uniref:Secreted protein n=1 Tax=Sulfuricella denitrificans (strain DSM 22764 / NBRC 105220 / skB26) TaxID=1163617 RepID=S6AJB4_SULDS|nr:hypothetical protein [Sulfuricella denitrificans]BAN36411.1 hypothetical protein SCD_n02610 [Sulfuricella denitrificans skB26]